MLTLSDITDRVLSYNPKANLDVIWQAYLFSAKGHRGQTRLSGGPYLSHPMEVAHILARLKMDTVTIAVGLLHDTVEDTYATLDEIREIFGEEVATLVDGVTKISRIEFASSAEQQAENLRKMILAMAKDIRVIMIKLADRLHNTLTLEFVPANQQKRVAQETLDIYAPIANRLGIGWLKSELEDNAFRFLNPQAHRDLQLKVTAKLEERSLYIQEVQQVVTAELTKADITGTIEGRPKHFYSICQKMQKQQISFDEVYDLTAMRIITDSIRNCYAILGLIHSLWTPIPGRFKDYVAMPKPNRYQSLHTTVIGPQGRPIEFQIRTDEMHRTAEEGIAAHWRYKEGGRKPDKDDRLFVWVRQLLEWQQELKDPKEFMDMVKIDLFPEEVYVFTPKGDVKALPKDATPVDFAYYIHTDIGHRCVGAKVNGKMVPLRQPLRNGDIVEILTSARHGPSRDWLKVVQTSRARTKIRAFLKAEQKERNLLLGRELLEKEIAKYDQALGPYLKSREMEEVAKRFSFVTVEDLLVGIGCGRISPAQVTTKLLPPDLPQVMEERRKREVARGQPVTPSKGSPPAEEEVQIKGLDNVLVRFAKCCYPVPGDRIVGFITRGRGISIHTADCPSPRHFDYEAERKIEVEWNRTPSSLHPIEIAAETVDEPGMLARVSTAIASLQVNISEATARTDRGRAYLSFAINIRDLEQLRAVLTAIQQVEGVTRVDRIKDTYRHRQKRAQQAGG